MCLKIFVVGDQFSMFAIWANQYVNMFTVFRTVNFFFDDNINNNNDNDVLDSFLIYVRRFCSSGIRFSMFAIL